MKYVSIVRLAPGVDNVTRAFEVFGKYGAPEGTQSLLAGTDGKTFVTILEADEPDMVGVSTYAPFFESTTIIPVVDVDEAWFEAIAKAISNVTG